jgi:hypothetical protein
LLGRHSTIWATLTAQGGSGVWIQGFSLAKQTLYHLSHTCSPFLFMLFWRWGVSRTICPDWSWSISLPISASQVSRITGVSHQCLTCVGYLWDKVLLYLINKVGWTQLMILMISVSWVARITGVSCLIFSRQSLTI